jgi:hypothetical protein
MSRRTLHRSRHEHRHDDDRSYDLQPLRRVGLPASSGSQSDIQLLGETHDSHTDITEGQLEELPR